MDDKEIVHRISELAAEEQRLEEAHVGEGLSDDELARKRDLEVTLQGRVLPIGGVKQKVLAAHRAGLTEVILPERNGNDLEDVPEEVRDVMTFHLAATIADVLTPALSGAGAPAADGAGEDSLGAAA